MTVPECCIKRVWCDGYRFSSSVKSSLGGIKSIASIVSACHGAFDIDSVRIDYELPADALTLGRNSMRPLFVVRQLGRISTSSKAANRQDVFPKRNLQVAVTSVRHFNGKHEACFVFLNCEAAIVLVFLGEAVRRRHCHG